MILGLVAGLTVVAGLVTSCLPTTTTSTDTTATSSSWTSTLLLVGFIVLIFVMMYFFTIRPQRKRQQDQAKMIHELQKGDRVVTIGGMYGTVESVMEDSVIIRVDSGATLRFVKSAIATRVTPTSEPPK
jgi:preprotein translocase subunit YajC